MALTVNTNSYIARADATTYFGDSIHYAEWTTVPDADKDRALVTATRMLERQNWVGEKTSSGQTLSWPRTGITDADGNEVSSSVVPQFIKDAQVELALMIYRDSTILDKSGTANNTKRLKAGTAEIEYFRPTTNKPFPTVVQELLGLYLANSSGLSAILAPTAYGTCEDSSFTDDEAYDLSEGYN